MSTTFVADAATARPARTAYSCVVDGAPKYEWEAANLGISLVSNAGVAPADVKLHVTTSVSAEFREFALARGFCLVPIEPFPGNHGYCNKIQQMFSPAFAGYARVVLCDCDLYFASSPETHFVEAPAAGCLVTRPNPPYALLHRVFESAGLQAPSPVPVRFPMSDADCTAPSNWNGGLYVFAAGELETWGHAWAAHATRLLAGDPGPLGQYRMFADQTGWALTLHELAIPFAQLPDTLSHPINPVLLECEGYRRTPSGIACFHLGTAMDPHGRIRPGGTAEIDAQIEAANRRIAETVLSRIDDDKHLAWLFQRWWDYRVRVS
jgi:hypothetical protein